MTAASDIRWDMSPAAIEAESFAIIEREFRGWKELPQAEWKVMRRLIHTTADLSIGAGLAFRHDPIPSALAALRSHCPIFCDSNMIRAGLSVERLRRAHPGYSREDIHCYISDADIAAQAKATGRTRAICAAEKARPMLDGAIVLIGNAPLSLARIARYVLEEGIRPALIVGMPVGFVNVVESKLLTGTCTAPQIVLDGRRGGSALAVTTLHAILENLPAA